MLETEKKEFLTTKEIVRRLTIAAGKEVAVGWVEGKANAETATIALINTFGAPRANIPARDTITPATDALAPDAAKAFGEDGAAALKGSAGDTLSSLADTAEARHKQEIADFNDPGNAPSTIAQKGFNDPLRGKGKDRLYKGAGAVVRDRTTE